MGFEDMMEKLVYETKRHEYRRPTFLPTNAVATGYIDLYYYLGGLRRGETYLLAAYSSIWETSFALNLIEKITCNCWVIIKRTNVYMASGISKVLYFGSKKRRW